MQFKIFIHSFSAIITNSSNETFSLNMSHSKDMWYDFLLFLSVKEYYFFSSKGISWYGQRDESIYDSIEWKNFTIDSRVYLDLLFEKALDNKLEYIYSDMFCELREDEDWMDNAKVLKVDSAHDGLPDWMITEMDLFGVIERY